MVVYDAAAAVSGEVRLVYNIRLLNDNYRPDAIYNK